MRHIGLPLLVLLACISVAHAAWTGKVIVWQEEHGQRVCEVLFTDDSGVLRADLIDLDLKVTEEDALKQATARLDDRLAGEAEAAKPQPAPVDWQAVAYAIAAEVHEKTGATVDVQKAAEGKPAVTTGVAPK